MNAPQLPAHLANRRSRNLAEALTANLGVGSPPYVSIMGNRFTLVDSAGAEITVPTYDPQIGPYIDCVLIDLLERTSKIFYDRPFDPGAQQYEPPACFSDNGIGPSANAAKPQSLTCAACPQGMWGSKVSAVSGKGVKACNDIQKIAVLVPGHEMPFLLRLPPNSRTNLRAYTEKFRASGVQLDFVVTRISFEQGQLGTLKFDGAAFVDEALTIQIDKILDAKATDVMIGRTDMPRQGALEPLAQTAQIEHQPAQTYAPNSQPLPQGTQVAQPVFQQPAQQSVVQPQAQPEPQQRRRRRSSAEVQAAQQPVAQPAPTQAPFMPQAQATAPAQPGTGPASNNFGIQAGAAPNAAMQNALDGLFGKK